MSKGFFVDLSICTACRGCQVACKQWNKLPATPTENWGSHQNPKDLSYSTYKLVHFQEAEVDGALKWLFFPEQCRHCVEPPCKMATDLAVEDAFIVDEATGAVIVTEKSKELTDYSEGSEICPYNIPRKDEASGLWSKCTMCIDRISNGMKPACVTTCPTGAMNFGDLEEMKAMAKARLEQLKGSCPNAVLGNPDEVRVIYLFPVDPKLYYSYAVAEVAPTRLNRKQLFARVTKPVRTLLSS